MGKNNKKRKKTNHALFHAVKEARLQQDQVVKSDAVATTIDPTPLSGAANADATATTTIHDDDNLFISGSDLSTTLTTLQKLAQHPQVLQQSKRYKELRRALHPLVVERLQFYDKGTDYRAAVTAALQAQQWSKALAALQGCRDFHQLPKQGTIQRWVRDCSTQGSTSITAECQRQLYQAILALSPSDAKNRDVSNKHDPAQALLQHLNTHSSTTAATNTAVTDGTFTVLPGWKWWQEDGNGVVVVMENTDSPPPSRDHEQEHDDPPATETSGCVFLPMTGNRILYRENAAERTPPNHYDLILHTTVAPTSGKDNDVVSDTNILLWATPPPCTTFHAIPFLPTTARVLSNVLTVYECQQLVRHMTTLGYRPDHPVDLPHPTGIDSCEWMMQASVMDTVFARVKAHLPPTLTLPNNQQVQLHSIDPRWRCFRYGQDCVYRPHLDGSWPQCYIDPQTGSYCCPKQSAIKSYLTFLIYLNDDFEGGETRFYLPGGVARGIVPKTGSVTVFPQGNMASLIHEGSQVTRGVKYVVRTDVLYEPMIEPGKGDNSTVAVNTDNTDTLDSNTAT